jgi:AcrR family transcriptional regulator
MLTSADQPAQGDERPLRRDAERNRRRILDAAEELFAERGLGVTLNDIAHHAGVGVGTVYRRFPDKAKLVDALFERHLELLAEMLEAAAADPDPWSGLTGFMRRSLETQAKNTALKDLLHDAPEGLEHTARVRRRLQPLAEELVRRAQESGQLRADVRGSDLAIIQMMLGSVIDGSRGIDDGLWRRYLELVLRGLHAEPQPPAPLPHPPLEFEAADRVMAACKFSRR